MKKNKLLRFCCLLGPFSIYLSSNQGALAERIDANDPRIDYVGRVRLTDDFAEYEWPCTSLRWQLTGSGEVHIAIAGGGNRFLLLVDGDEREITTKKFGKETIGVKLSIPGQHQLELRKLTEASYFVSPLTMTQGPARFYGLHIQGDLQLGEAAPQRHTMEVFGDSSLNGFGVLKSSKDSLSTVFNLARYESCDKGYPAKIARHFDARIHVEAWSGKGVVKDAIEVGTKSKNPMPAYWQRTLATRSGLSWTFADFTPELILVHLGGNDYYSRPYPQRRDFEKAYVKLLAKIVASYAPNRPTLITLCGKDLHHVETSCPPIEAATATFAKTYPEIHFVQIPPSLFNAEDWGTLNHLSEQGNEKVKNFLAPVISDIMGWEEI